MSIGLFGIVGEAHFGKTLETVRVLNYTASLMMADDVVLASAIEPPKFFIGRAQQIPVLDYFGFGIVEARMLHLFNKCDYMMTIHNDGFILNPKNWEDEFLAYDYIGATWCWETGQPAVGNGGFCIRSRKFME